MSLRLTGTFRDALAAASRPLVGMWACTGSPVLAEVDAGSGLDWLLIDGEHGPNTLESILVQLQVVAAYPISPLVRVPWNEPVFIKQVLDIGAQNLIVPMISSADEAAAAVAATRYPPAGFRGVGSALARSARWNRVDGYLGDGSSHVSLTVQIENAAGVDAAAAIAAVDGVDQVFVGPSDLAASMGLLGQQTHPEVVDAVHRTFAAVHGAGKKVGVNAFDPAAAEAYLQAGADFIAVGADVAMLARAAEGLAARFIPAADRTERASY
ncbi:aldolase/citrate lyase family protein [Microbacterium horticulturae]|uniref:Aldolase/citrate lyase family protein n=1 Tax=Microbacterium horticulturae TaxID=3028316 RepID=A0ABY8BVV4_9MICO|nr:aldolase/citrate lyase family protein [Microbacterium sp. KACC 23027]WEG08030.1 aldolase/citrate lyase family protein [Microbacterium sp. KACC 23027]